MGRATSIAAVEGAPRSAWPRRLALATLCVAVPLAFFGGSVTTLEAGLAIDGWLVLEPGRGDWFLWFYPVEQWFRDAGTFVEHTHRLLGSAVGLLAIATVVACLLRERGAARGLSVAALAAVIAQGTLGGLRVLEKSDDLAFLHGAFGQAVFALLAATWIATSPAWQAARARAIANAAPLRSAALLATAAVYAQIVAGAWLRHGGSGLALLVHLVLILAVVGAVVRAGRELRAASAEPALDPAEASALRRCARTLHALLWAQVALGVGAFFSVYVLVGKVAATVEQGLFPTLHVLGGAALLCASVATLLWTRRIAPAHADGRDEAAARELPPAAARALPADATGGSR